MLLAAVSAGVMMTATAAFGQDAAAAPKREETLITVIFGHIDFVFVIIGILSVIGLTLIIQGFIKNRASAYMPEESVGTIRDLIGQKKFKELIEFTENDPSFVSRALNPALKRAPSFSSMKEAMETAIGEQTAERFRSIEYLNIIGNLGPLLGLTGTVLGMIQAFNDMMNAGKEGADPSKLAGGISRALAHTFLGLFLAVPTLASFGILRTLVDRLTVRAALTCEELLLMVKPQESKPAGAPPAGGPPRAPGAPGVPPPPQMRKPAAPAPSPMA
jgi:biopolymer transport protein ExbB